MYLPRQFEESRVDVLHELMRETAFATLVTLETAGLNANHLPLVLDAEPGPFGTLRGHVSRANNMWRDGLPDVDALAIFQGPHTYITPAWYPTKEETGRVVPTWNYVVVHAYGRLRFYDDADRLRAHVERLTELHESERAAPWNVSDAPNDFITGLLKGIVGFEMTVSRLLGKWKVSQNRTDADRKGVVAGLRAGDEVAVEMAKEVEGRLGD
jgi:transcriptional regulator